MPTLTTRGSSGREIWVQKRIVNCSTISKTGMRGCWKPDEKPPKLVPYATDGVQDAINEGCAPKPKKEVQGRAQESVSIRSTCRPTLERLFHSVRDK